MITNNYNLSNKHERDAALAFEEVSHTYTVNGATYRSVTELIDKHFPQFDADL